MGDVHLLLDLFQLGLGGQDGSATVDGDYFILRQDNFFVVLCHMNVLILPLLASGCFGPTLLLFLLFLLLVYRALRKDVLG